MSNIDELRNEIKRLESNINNGVYDKEELLLANDMLKTKKDELSRLKAKQIKPIPNAPIKGLQRKKPKRLAQMDNFKGL